MGILDAIERDEKRKIRSAVGRTRGFAWYRTALTSFVSTPFIVTAFIFVPFLGQVLALLSIAAAALLLFLCGTLRDFLCALLGACSSAVLLALLVGLDRDAGPPILYVLLGGCVFISGSLIVFLSAVLWLRYERAVLNSGTH